MRYYIVNSEGKEVSFDVTTFKSNVGAMLGLNVVTSDKDVKTYYVKSLAGRNYVSEDKLEWEKVPAISSHDHLVNINEMLKVYRGFKPSGLNNLDAGALSTDMPGKVVKLLTAEGAVVNQGDTLLILEAMKMENEIKAGVDGVVKAVHVEEGMTLETGHLMIEIEE